MYMYVYITYIYMYYMYYMYITYIYICNTQIYYIYTFIDL